MSENKSLQGALIQVDIEEFYKAQEKVNFLSEKFQEEMRTYLQEEDNEERRHLYFKIRRMLYLRGRKKITMQMPYLELLIESDLPRRVVYVDMGDAWELNIPCTRTNTHIEFPKDYLLCYDVIRRKFIHK